eukprot:429440_1
MAMLEMSQKETPKEDLFHSFKQCEFRDNCNDKWIECEINWHYMNKSIDMIYNNKQTTTHTIYDSIFIQTDTLYIECKEYGTVYEFRGINLLPMIDEIIKNGLLHKCTWIVPLMYQVAANDEKIWNQFNQWMTKQHQLEKADNNLNRNSWQTLTQAVQDKLTASQILSDSIKSISRRHLKISKLITKEDLQVLTEDAKSYVNEIKSASNELWDLCLDITTFAAQLSIESKLNKIRIKQWKELKTIDVSDTKSVLYRKIEKGIKKIINFGCNEKMLNKANKINEKIAGVKQKFVILESQLNRLKTINEEKEEPVSLSTKVGLGIFIGGAISGATTASIALAVVVSASLSNPIGWIVTGGIIGAIGIIGGIAFGVKYYKERKKNRKIQNKNEQIMRCKQKFEELNKIVKDSKNECFLISKAMKELSNFIEQRNEISVSEGSFDIECLELLEDIFSACIKQCDELKQIINKTQQEILTNN